MCTTGIELEGATARALKSMFGRGESIKVRTAVTSSRGSAATLQRRQRTTASAPATTADNDDDAARTDNHGSRGLGQGGKPAPHLASLLEHDTAATAAPNVSMATENPSPGMPPPPPPLQSGPASSTDAVPEPGVDTRVTLETNQCHVCAKRVYAMELLGADGKVFHKQCFKCSQCCKTVGLGSYASLDSKIYCKPHFKQLFKLKGNYNEGFGTEQHKHRWSTMGLPHSG